MSLIAPRSERERAWKLQSAKWRLHGEKGTSFNGDRVVSPARVQIAERSATLSLKENAMKTCFVLRNSLVALLCLSNFQSCSKPDPLPGLIQNLDSTNVNQRRDSAYQLGQLGPAASSAVPALVNRTSDSDQEVRRASVRALGEIGTPRQKVLDAIRNALSDKELPVRMAAALAMETLDPESIEPRTVLLEALRLGEGGTIIAVGRRGPNAAWAVPAFTELLKDQRPGVRRLAAEALGKVGTSAVSASMALETLLQDPDDQVREAAQRALVAVKGDRQ